VSGYKCATSAADRQQKTAEYGLLTRASVIIFCSYIHELLFSYSVLIINFAQFRRRLYCRFTLSCPSK